jgi:ABC-2 type transport system permease protein
MMNKIPSAQQSLRIILAITSKDILDAARNRTILSLIVSALFLSAFFTFMPMLSDTGAPLVFLADAGQSFYTKLIAGSDSLRVRQYPSADEMKADFIQRADNQLALVLPADFDGILAIGNIPHIQAYVMNWVSDKTIAEKKTNIQARLAAIIGSPVQIDVNSEKLYMLPESNGGFIEAIGITIILLTTGMLLVPHLMLEEKRARTMEALLVSPANSSQIAIAKTLTGVLYVLFFAILVVGANAYLIQQWNVVVWTVLLSILVSVSIGLLLGILIQNRQHLTIINQVLLVPLILPILLRIFNDLIPGWLSNVIQWIPSAVIFDLLRFSFSNQSAVGYTLPRLGILVISFIALFGLSAWLIQRVER